jgi:6-pyruvoyltetrahydropterin/6-carboxytetrahydropterin synthase
VKKVLKEQVEMLLDHHYINEVKPFDKTNPTAENIAYWMFWKLHDIWDGGQVEITSVGVWESDSCGVIYEP